MNWFKKLFDLDSSKETFTPAAPISESTTGNNTPKMTPTCSGDNHEKQVMALAALPVHALEILKQTPDTLVLTMPDGVELKFNESELADALQAAKLMEKGDKFFQLKQYAKADEAYHLALKLNPIDPILLMSLGNVLCLEGKIEEGIQLLKKSLDICPLNFREKARVSKNYYGAKAHFGK